jgi:hypothetical protein
VNRTGREGQGGKEGGDFVHTPIWHAISAWQYAVVGRFKRIMRAQYPPLVKTAPKTSN